MKHIKKASAAKYTIISLFALGLILNPGITRPVSAASDVSISHGIFWPSVQACENATVIKRSVTVSKDNAIEVITTPAASKDCPISMTVTYKWGQWDHPLFPQITKDPDISVRFGSTTGGYFPRPTLTCDANRVCTVVYSGIPEIVKKEPVYYLVRLEYSFFRMFINCLPFMGTDTIECDAEISYSPCTATPYLTLEPVAGTGLTDEPADFTATLHNWDFTDEAGPQVTYEWYIEGIKKYQSSEQAPVSQITHTFDSAGDKTVRVHVVQSTTAGTETRTLKPLFKEKVTFKVK